MYFIFVATAIMGPKQKLRSSEDVYNRILHDDAFDPNAVWIGYEDRLVGAVELPLSEFVPVDQGGDLPMHRIRYFCRGEEVLWDRRRHLDSVFCSGHTKEILRRGGTAAVAVATGGSTSADCGATGAFNPDEDQKAQMATGKAILQAAENRMRAEEVRSAGTECKFFKLGSCRAGRNCMFKHGKEGDPNGKGKLRGGKKGGRGGGKKGGGRKGEGGGGKGARAEAGDACAVGGRRTVQQDGPEYDTFTPCGYFMAGWCRYGEACSLQHSTPYALAIRQEWLCPGDARAKKELRAVACEILGPDVVSSVKLFPRVFSRALGQDSWDLGPRNPQGETQLDADAVREVEKRDDEEDGFTWEEDEKEILTAGETLKVASEGHGVLSREMSAVPPKEEEREDGYTWHKPEAEEDKGGSVEPNNAETTVSAGRVAKQRRWSRRPAGADLSSAPSPDPASRSSPWYPAGCTSTSSVPPAGNRFEGRPRGCRLRKLRYLLVLDLEGKEEITEFPVIAIDTEVGRELGRFQRYVRPTRAKVLSEDSPAVPFSVVLEEFDRWVRKTLDCGGLEELGRREPPEVALLTCGDWDCHHVHTQCALSGIRPVPALFRRWVNIKRAWGDLYSTKVNGMRSMLSRLGLLGPGGKVKHGFHHLGMHDVENIGRCLLHLLKVDAGSVAINGWRHV